jgi:hypothetical protein
MGTDFATEKAKQTLELHSFRKETKKRKRYLLIARQGHVLAANDSRGAIEDEQLLYSGSRIAEVKV